MVILKKQRAEITIRGRIIEDMQKDGELLRSIPTVSLGSVFRTQALQKGIIIEMIKTELEDDETEGITDGKIGGNNHS